MIGAYFSGSGAMIRSGAAGLGEYFGSEQGAVPPPVVTAFQDGVFSSGRADVWMEETGDDPGPLRSYQDGSLGACAGCGVGNTSDMGSAGIGYPLFVDGKPIDRPVTIVHGPSPMGTSEGKLMAYRDGSLGEYFSGEAPRAGAFRSGVLGAVVAGSKTLDLTDPQALKETKMAIAMFVPEIAFADASVNPATNVGAKYYDEAFYADPLWGEKAEELWSAAVQKLTKLKLDAQEVSQTSKGHNFPTASGLSTALAYGAGAPVGDPKAFTTNYPVLSTWYAQVAAAKGDLSGFKVSAPFFSTQEKVSGKGTFAGMSTASIVGIGAVMAIGAFLVFRKK